MEKLLEDPGEDRRMIQSLLDPLLPGSTPKVTERLLNSEQQEPGTSLLQLE